ncbi:MAG TPA: hypothetical protein VJQ56_15465 [Blastocatellia bacterium]|nr:hypothetical protein [Blastocatellia bacterium]
MTGSALLSATNIPHLAHLTSFEDLALLTGPVRREPLLILADFDFPGGRAATKCLMSRRAR